MSSKLQGGIASSTYPITAPVTFSGGRHSRRLSTTRIWSNIRMRGLTSFQPWHVPLLSYSQCEPTSRESWRKFGEIFYGVGSEQYAHSCENDWQLKASKICVPAPGLNHPAKVLLTSS
jgi:hypothetical protein